MSADQQKNIYALIAITFRVTMSHWGHYLGYLYQGSIDRVGCMWEAGHPDALSINPPTDWFAGEGHTPCGALRWQVRER